MSSKHALLGFGAAAVLSVCCIIAAESAPAADTPGFIAGAFRNPPAPAKLALAGPLAVRVSQILGHKYAQPEITYWWEADVTAWILQSKAKSGRITAGLVIKDGKVATCEVLAYTESRGREIRSPRFLKQLTGTSLRDGQLDREVDGITGATLSVNALRNLTRLALTLDGTARDKDTASGTL